LAFQNTVIWKTKLNAMSKLPIVVEESNLTDAWINILDMLLKNRGELSPLVLSLTDFDENVEAKKILSKHLNANGMPSIDEVAETIFPYSLYEYVEFDRDKLYAKYKKNLPRVKKINSSNRNGTYFSRLIAFDDTTDPVNQLEIIISALKSKKSVRRSKLQAGIFDPTTDHTNSQMQGFPCLQHVTFFRTKEGGLIINSFYAVQFFFKRAYGNWLGIINLGKFVAQETGLELERFNCFIGAEVLDNIKRPQARTLLNEMGAKR